MWIRLLLGIFMVARRVPLAMVCRLLIVILISGGLRGRFFIKVLCRMRVLGPELTCTY